ncbi:MAG: beta-N-acetylhexosaminidase [Clostridium sartagoforme]|nr:beta-N-acetylhexosaminidase [Clostridium sartagoforme]
MKYKNGLIVSLIFIIFSVVLISVNNINHDKEFQVYGEANSTNNTIIPRPLNYEENQGKFILNKDTIINVNGKNEAETSEIYKIAEYLKDKLKLSTGYDFNINKGEATKDNYIYLTTIGGNVELGDEGYEMVTSSNGIEIKANKPEGLFRGIQTIRQLLPPDIASKTVVSNIEWSIPNSKISDQPEYSYRGFMIDVARHFFTEEEIKKQIDFAAQYKINRLHLHLTDDQGWRIEIKKYPDLTRIGGSTEVGGGPGGYYTQDQFKSIVQYAADRYIEIIPEVDMPGHTNAALASYGFLNPDGKRKPLYTGTNVGFSTLMTDSEKTYEFIEDVVKEISEISPSKYFHMGGDEADSTKKEDYDYFVGRVSKIVQKYGKTPIGWDPIDTAPEINSSVILQNWKDSNEAAVKKNMNMIISIAGKAYLDMKYNKDTPYGSDWAGYIPIETAYNWDPTDFAQKDLVLGIEAPLWTENILDVEQMEYMIYPRLLGYAEIGWTPKNLRNWEEYKIRLENQGERLTNEGINYYRDNSIWKNK